MRIITQDEIDFYKPYLPTYSDEDIKNTIHQADVQAAIMTYESMIEL